MSNLKVDFVDYVGSMTDDHEGSFDGVCIDKYVAFFLPDRELVAEFEVSYIEGLGNRIIKFTGFNCPGKIAGQYQIADLTEAFQQFYHKKLVDVAYVDVAGEL